MTGIVNSSGVTVVTYTYDAWGNILSVSGADAATLGTINPLRYRGYVYDRETGLYYLQSRYYNPAIGRFINADNYPTTGQGFSGNNMFAYCGNNPVFRVDDGGEFWFRAIVGAVVGAAVSAVVETTKQVVKHVATGKPIDTNAIVAKTIGGAAYGATMAVTGSDTVASLVSTAATTVTTGIQNGDSAKKIMYDTIVQTADTAFKQTVSRGLNKALSGKYLKLNPFEKFLKWWTDEPYKGKYVREPDYLADSITGTFWRAGRDLLGVLDEIIFSS